MTKLYITGGPGSGKTTYAQRLAHRFNIPCFDLDDVKWMNTGSKGAYNQKRNKIERDKIVQDILSKPNWICEGVYFKEWVLPLMQEADKVIILKPATYVRQYRILKRSLKRLFNLEYQKHRETLLRVYSLLKWSGEYDKKYFPKLIEQIKQVETPYKIITRRGN